ncbi:MAG: AMP-binding protein [Clostridium sp.]|nr:AMP-binding protein [Clostridium sp.]
MNTIKVLFDLYRLKKNTKKSAEQMKKMQDKKLRKMLCFAWENSRYYRTAFENAGIEREQLATLPLSAFPTIDKRALLEHFEELITVPDLTQEEIRKFDAEGNREEKTFRGCHIVHSSGSTGTPGYFVYDETAWNRMLLGIIRGALWNMSMPQIVKLLAEKPRIAYIAATEGRYGGAMAVGDGIDGVGAEQMYLDINTPLEKWVDNIRAFKPNMIIGYPSAIKILGELVENGEIEMDVMRIISCGEPLGRGLRHFLETVFHAEVINFYGASESLAMGVETGKEEGMILFDDMNVIEVEEDAMYLTSLYNFAQPLIRYRISDRLVLKEPADGSPFSRAEILLGRDEDMLWFEDGKGNRDFLHPLAVEGFCIKGLRDYQFRKIDRAAFEILAEVSGEARRECVRAEMQKQMEKILTEKKLSYVQFYIHFVKEIPPDSATGKKPLILADCQAVG